MRHIAIESGAFVVSVPQYIPAAAFPSDFPVPLPDGEDVFGRGGACIVHPSGEVLAGPVYDAEVTVSADCDLREALHAKRCTRSAAREALLRRGRPLLAR